jgi:hypothetical protein
MIPLILIEEVSCVGDESQEHTYLAPDVNLAIDVPGVSFYRTGPYVQRLGYVAVAKALAYQLGYFALAWRQVIPVLHVRPLPFVEQYDFGLLVVRAATAWIVVV